MSVIIEIISYSHLVLIKIIYDILILACDLRGLDTTELNSALSELSQQRYREMYQKN